MRPALDLPKNAQKLPRNPLKPLEKFAAPVPVSSKIDFRGGRTVIRGEPPGAPTSTIWLKFCTALYYCLLQRSAKFHANRAIICPISRLTSKGYYFRFSRLWSKNHSWVALFAAPIICHTALSDWAQNFTQQSFYIEDHTVKK